MTILIRITVYTILPLLLAAGHIALRRRALSRAQMVELALLYVFAIGIGANGVGGFFAHFFLSDIVAEAIGWAPGSPFQLEIAFANLAIGVLGFMAVDRRDGFRTATIVALTVFSVGATVVHLMDIIATGNLAPGNTIQNASNLLRPSILIILSALAGRYAADAESVTIAWQRRHGSIAIATAIGVSSGYGIGFAVGAPLVLALVGAFAGLTAGRLAQRRKADVSRHDNLASESTTPGGMEAAP